MILLWVVPAAVVTLAALPVWPVDPQPRRGYAIYYDPDLLGVRWNLDGER